MSDLLAPSFSSAAVDADVLAEAYRRTPHGKPVELLKTPSQSAKL
jgi:hypothetical protein